MVDQALLVRGGFVYTADAGGMMVLPGFVNAHWHEVLCWAEPDSAQPSPCAPVSVILAGSRPPS
ncbi:imidazolonepropionase-like amidohydrolase [Kibdelosporangium banguiense]|uniref:Imidazolonepropionase-like amidohydrolase n=1 Tax=Kibdelosporangium banguiense TaxID=1365924 RepID=A0ABS4U293_9PSEU|nr:hypothetical protein [Kibdelosporangium banguiense]MBP2330782.1 imidazolonepropionase-like amidohydrolase [Kibdelosporangium banguiense]